MFKFSNKPILIATTVLTVIVGMSLKLALAVTAFTPASQPVGYVAQDDLTNYDLTSGNETVFRGQYEKEYWSGNLIAYRVDATGNIATATQPWNGGAAYQLEQQGPANRYIVTMKSDGTKIPFAWSSLSSGTVSQQTDLVSSAVLNYLRGDRTGEVQQGGNYRQRLSAMGDVVHSRPFYLSDSTSGTPQPTVFVGANDGMLHAINATTGAERWAYVPSMLIPKMAKLSTAPAAGATFPHDYYVDGSMAIANILSGSKRVLVGALGAGGKGLYALNITGSSRLAPVSEAAAADNILWEITPSTINNAASNAYANLGYTYANPTVAKVGATDTVIVGNGYNNGGDYQAYLYLINADTGALISAIKAGTSGTAASPNGLSTPVAVGTGGIASIVYAGDLNGTMWKFDLRTSPATVTALLTTAPAQPITMSPGVSAHPSGGYMVNFATGFNLTSADLADKTSVFSAYGIWDGAPVENTALLTQTLTERCYTTTAMAPPTPCTSRVRTVTRNQPDWSAGATHHKGWKVSFPAGEKVVGDGGFIANGRFYFTSSNPTVTTTVPVSGTPQASDPTINGENWLLELDYMTGGAPLAPFLDVSGDRAIDDYDRVKLTQSPYATDTTTDGIPVGRFIANGVLSQPVRVQLSTLNNTLFNQNPDSAAVTAAIGTGAGVTGGHFDVDIFFGSVTAGASATAKLTIGTTGQQSPFPATLGDITVNGVVIVPAMTVSELTNGGASSSTNAAAIATKLINANNGFSVSRSNNVLTITAPAGTQFNGKSISVGAGTSQTLVAAKAAVAEVVYQAPVSAVRPTGFITFSGSSAGTTTGGSTRINNDLNNSTTVTVGGSSVYSNNINIAVSQTSQQVAASVATAIGTSGTYRAYVGGNTITPLCRQATTNVVCIVDTSTYSNGRALVIGSIRNSSGGTLSATMKATAGGTAAVAEVLAVAAQNAVAQSGWTNFAPAVTATAFDTNGVNAVTKGDTCSTCTYDTHVHQYDDVYDVTGVNAVNPSTVDLRLSRGMPSVYQDFKILVHNQYLNPAVKLNIGDKAYDKSLDAGYISVKNYTTSATLDLATLQTYRRDPTVVWPPSGATTTAQQLAAPKPISNLVFNMPLDALTAKDWWGGAVKDVRVGLIPLAPSCVYKSAGNTDGNMYKPVIPPVNGIDGPGKAGWSNTTTPATATGARHGGALTIQLIRADTPNSAIELNVAGRPEYGWRVKSSEFSNWTLVEYATYWHHPNNYCFNSTGWTDTPGADDGSSTQKPIVDGSTDPHLGNLSAGSSGTGTGTITGVSTTVTGAVSTTVVNYTDGSIATIIRTVSGDGKTVTVVTTDGKGNSTTQIVLNSDGSLKTGGDELGAQRAKTGRISWHELVAP